MADNSQGQNNKESYLAGSSSAQQTQQDKGNNSRVGKHARVEKEESSMDNQQQKPGHQPTFGKPKKRSKLKIALVVVLVVLFILASATAGFAVWYTGKLDSALDMGHARENDIEEVLTSGTIQEPFYVLVLGSDSREGSNTSTKESESGDNERSDVMILLRVDASKRQLTMVTIPRDTPYVFPSGEVGKINEVYNIGGATASIEAVADLTGVPISHYAEIRFSELVTLIDKLGGVEVEVPLQLSYIDALTGEKVTIETGKQTLNGQQAQIFVRARKEYGDQQDVKRQNNTRNLMMAILDKALDKPLYELPGTILDLAECVGTDLDSDEIVSLTLAYAGGAGKMTVNSCSGPSEGAIDEVSGLWLCYENPEGWTKLMGVVDSGADPKDVDVESTAIIPHAFYEAA